jgi:hypothetical protein
MNYTIYLNELIFASKSRRSIVKCVLDLTGIDRPVKVGRKLLIFSPLEFEFLLYNINSFSSYLAHQRAIKAHLTKKSNLKQQIKKFYFYDLDGQKKLFKRSNIKNYETNYKTSI